MNMKILRWKFNVLDESKQKTSKKDIFSITNKIRVSKHDLIATWFKNIPDPQKIKFLQC